MYAREDGPELECNQASGRRNNGGTKHMSRNTQGEIPDDHHENDAGPKPKEKAPLLDQELNDHIAALKKKRKSVPGD